MRELTVINQREIRTDNKIRQGRRIHGLGIIVRLYKSLKPKKSMCHGCRDDFYNDHNPYGVKECWGFKNARVVDKVGHSSIHVCGGPDTRIVKTLSCWNSVSK